MNSIPTKTSTTRSLVLPVSLCSGTTTTPHIKTPVFIICILRKKQHLFIRNTKNTRGIWFPWLFPLQSRLPQRDTNIFLRFSRIKNSSGELVEFCCSCQPERPLCLLGMGKWYVAGMCIWLFFPFLLSEGNMWVGSMRKTKKDQIIYL